MECKIEEVVVVCGFFTVDDVYALCLRNPVVWLRAAAQVTALALRPFPVLDGLAAVSFCFQLSSSYPDDPSEPYTYRHERCRCPRRAQRTRQEAG